MTKCLFVHHRFSSFFISFLAIFSFDFLPLLLPFIVLTSSDSNSTQKVSVVCDWNVVRTPTITRSSFIVLSLSHTHSVGTLLLSQLAPGVGYRPAPGTCPVHVDYPKRLVRPLHSPLHSLTHTPLHSLIHTLTPRQTLLTFLPFCLRYSPSTPPPSPVKHTHVTHTHVTHT